MFRNPHNSKWIWRVVPHSIFAVPCIIVYFATSCIAAVQCIVVRGCVRPEASCEVCERWRECEQWCENIMYLNNKVKSFFSFVFTKILPYEKLRKNCYFLDLEKILYENLRKIWHKCFTLRTLRTKKLNPTKFPIFTLWKTPALIIITSRVPVLRT